MIRFAARLVTLVPLVVGAVAPCLASAPASGPSGPDDGASFALRAGRVLPVTASGPWQIDDGLVIVRDGRIAWVGPWSLEAADRAADLPILHRPDSTVMPGLVAAATGLGGSHAGRESIGAGYRAADAFDRYADLSPAVGSGVTSAHIGPGRHRLVSGQGAVVKLGGPPEGRVVVESADLSINLGDEVLNPPPLIVELDQPGSDQFIRPPVLQRPTSRSGAFAGLRDVLTLATRPGAGAPPFHDAALAEAWRAGTPLRIRADRAADLRGASSFLRGTGRRGYIVAGPGAGDTADDLAGAAGIVYVTAGPISRIAADLGADPDAAFDAAIFDDAPALAAVAAGRLALSVGESSPLSDLRLAASLARRAGLSDRAVIEAITRVPAELLGVSDRVGSLAPGLDADLVIIDGDPLETAARVDRVYVSGVVAYDAGAISPASGSSRPTVVRAGTIWLGPDQWLENGSLLIEDGRISAVGKRVPSPPTARVIDAGPGSFVTPGFIDARGHLGFGSDADSPGPELSPALLVGAADAADRRVAAAGVTTVLVTPRSLNASGSQVAAVRTSGADRASRVVRPTAAVAFDLRDADPAGISDRLRPRFEQAKKYAESWDKYRQDLAAWEKSRAEGAAAPSAPAATELTTAAGPDPITGTWQGRVSGGPLPRPLEGKIALRLSGNSFEGRVIEPVVPVDHRIVGTLEGNRLTGRIELDTGGLGVPQLEATIEREDFLRGTISVSGVAVAFEATRVDKAALEFRVQRTRRTSKDGRPLPPRVDESLEPLRAVIDKKIPVVADVRTAAQVRALLDFLEPYGARTVLLNAEESSEHADRLAKASVGVIVPASPVRPGADGPYHQGDDLSRRGVPVAFQSGAADGARALPLVGLSAVERGLSAEEALAAFTTDAAAMFGLEDRIGRLAPGRDADLIIFSGHPFDTGSRVERVLVGGVEVEP